MKKRPRSYIRKELQFDSEALLCEVQVKKILEKFRLDFLNYTLIKVLGGKNRELRRRIEEGYTFTELLKYGGFKHRGQCSDYLSHMVKLGVLEKKGRYYRVRKEYYLIAKRDYEISLMKNCKVNQIFSLGLIDESLIVDISVYGVHEKFLDESCRRFFLDNLRILCADYFVGVFDLYVLWILERYSQRLLDDHYAFLKGIEDEAERRVKNKIFLYYFYLASNSILLKAFTKLNPMYEKYIPQLRLEEREALDKDESTGPDLYVKYIKKEISDALKTRRHIYKHIHDLAASHEKLVKYFGKRGAREFEITVGRPFGENSESTLVEVGKKILEIGTNGSGFIYDDVLKVPIVVTFEEILEIRNRAQEIVNEAFNEIEEKVRPPLVIISPSDLSHPRVLETYYNFHKLSSNKEGMERFTEKRLKWLREKLGFNTAR